MISFPFFEPDKSTYELTAGDNLLNCLPVANGWGPMPDFVVRSDALPADCLGLFFYMDAQGVFTVIAGTATNLYKLNTSTEPYSWTNVSQVADGYSVPAGGRWCMRPFGTTLIAVNGADVPQKFDIASGVAFADLGGSPPIAKYVEVVGSFVVLYNIDGDPSKVVWSGVENAEYWTAGQRASDLQSIPVGVKVQSIVPSGQGAFVAMRDVFWAMQFTPSSSFVFSFALLNSARGVIAPQSVIRISEDQFLYLSEDGFFSGVTGTPIGAERVDRWFLDDQVDKTYLPEVEGFADPYNKIAWWKFQTVSGESRLLGYDWQLDRWCYSDQNFQAAAAIATPATTLEGIDNLYPGGIDSVPLSLDSRLFAGGRPVLAIIDEDRKLAFMAATNKAATLETAAANHTPGHRSRVNSGFIVGDCNNYTVTVSTSPFFGQDFTARSAVSPSSRSGRLPFNYSGMHHKYRLNIPAGETWSHVHGIEVDWAKEGTA